MNKVLIASAIVSLIAIATGILAVAAPAAVCFGVGINC